MKNIIYFIFDKNCPTCLKMRQTIVYYLKYFKLDELVEIVELCSDSDEAVDLAVERKIYDLPGCWINGKSIYGKDFKNEDIKNSIENLYKEINGK